MWWLPALPPCSWVIEQWQWWAQLCSFPVYPLVMLCVPQRRMTGQLFNSIFPLVLLPSYSFRSAAHHLFSRLQSPLLFFTGLESGGVTLKEPASEGEIESSAPVTLRCHIDGHPRWVSCSSECTGSRTTKKAVLKNNFSVLICLFCSLMFLYFFLLSLVLTSQANLPVVQGRCEADWEEPSDQ